jgi:hypothetical protein
MLGLPAASIGQQRQMLASFTSPDQIKQWAAGQAMAADKLLPTIQTRNTGATTDTLAIDPLTGKPAVTGSVRNTMSPDAAARIAEDRRQFGITQQNAGNTYDSERGLIVNTRSGEARPVTAGGQALPGKLSEGDKKELTSINQQRSIINGALKEVDATPSAFSFGRGTATMAGALPESVAGRFDSDAERQARSYVFNNVSKVINERAGAAQSAQELARLRSFLPAETDNADQIRSKLQAFNTYLGDLEAGTRAPKSGGAPAPAPKPVAAGPKVPKISGDAEYAALPSGATFIGPDGKTRRKP